MRRQLSLGLAIAVAACGDHREAPLATSLSPPATAPRGTASVVPAGWRREDLAKLGLAASIAVPGGAKLTNTRQPERDPDGLAITIPIVTITTETFSVQLSTDVVLGWVPTTAAADLADNARRERPFVVERTKDVPTGEWAIAYRWDTADCYVHGWSPRANVWCETGDLKIQCAAVATPLAMCTSLEPSGPPIMAAFDANAAFPQVTDPQAAEAAAAVARAISRNDRDALLGMVGPTGLTLKGKRLSLKALRALLGTDTVQRAFEMPCKPLPGHRASRCVWNAEAAISDGTLAILANDGYGLVPRFTLTKSADARWLLTSVDLADLGAP